MAESQPESFEMMKVRIAGQKGRLIGGLDTEVDLSLLSPQDLRRTLAAGKQKYVKLGLAPPTVYSQYKRGMVPELPMHLVQLSYEGAILFDWESASYPVGNQGKISWEGADGYGIDTIANYVLDASSPSSFLAIGSTLGSQLDHHQVPT